uniref:Putative reverse transcriptase domain-containing protein n=1 Tax=Tanacetum cinerariifolium TaxID=118510 RepID=A0A6L2MZ45_TANCI|nr:putative reverse transcriptase domain-containing protein [Tanacetum cinerariifolium]
MVTDALSRKKRVKPKRVRAMNITLQSSIKDMILSVQKEAVDESARLQKGLDCDTPKSGWQRNVEYPKALLHRLIAQDMRMTTNRVI